MQKILLLCTLFFSSVIIHASNFEFVVWTKAGDQIVYALNVKPKIINTSEILVLSTTETSVEYHKSAVAKFTLNSNPCNLEDNIIKNNICQLNDRILLKDCQAGTIVKICDISGKPHFCQVIYDPGNLEIPISEYNKGIYIISINTFTYKFIKNENK